MTGKSLKISLLTWNSVLGRFDHPLERRGWSNGSGVIINPFPWNRINLFYIVFKY